MQRRVRSSVDDLLKVHRTLLLPKKGGSGVGEWRKWSHDFQIAARTPSEQSAVARESLLAYRSLSFFEQKNFEKNLGKISNKSGGYAKEIREFFLVLRKFEKTIKGV